MPEYINFDDDDTDFSTLDRGDSHVDDEDQEDQEVEDQEDEDQEDSEDSEEESEEEDSVGEDEEVEEEEVKPKKLPKIPKDRLDKALRQRDEYKDRALWLEEQLEKLIEQNSTKQEKEKVPPPPPYDFDGAEEQYVALLLEGETAKAVKLRREIDNQRQLQFQNLIAEIEERAIEKATQTSSASTENAKFQALIENYENKYPFLDSEHDDYNEEAIDTVNTLLAGYIAKGISKSEALKKAVGKVAPMFVQETKATKKSVGQERKVEANKKAASAIKSQPPKTRSSASNSVDTSKLDISKMSERDFAKLTQKELKALRGD